MTRKDLIPNERLRAARERKRWTQEALAVRLETDFETVSRWERGETIPRSDFRRRLCDVFDLPAEELGLASDRNEPFILPASPYLVLASSHADADHELVIRLKQMLTDRGIAVLSSRMLQRQGKERKRQAIRAAQGVVVIVSPDARSSRHVQEALQVAKMYERPICTLWIDGDHWQECVPEHVVVLDARIDARKGLEPAMLDQISTLLHVPALQSPTVSHPELSQPQQPLHQPRNPYKGLHAFRREDTQDFFGRDALVNELLAALETVLAPDQPSSARLLAVLGPSGSGKSSVVMAGLLPRLQAGNLPGSETWIYLKPIVPGVHPLASLGFALAEVLPEKHARVLHEQLEGDSSRILHLLAQTLIKQQGDRVVLFIDQFEELFTQTSDEQERQRFIDLLVTAITEPRGALVVLLSLRADFYDQLTRYPALAALIQQHHRLVLSMTIRDLRAVIEGPASQPDVQLTFEENLVGDLLFDSYDQVGALPLLEFTLDQLFQQRSDHRLTMQSYREMGGVKGALAKHAEATYASLPSEEHRQLTRSLFLRLIDPGLSEQDTTRRRASLSELSLPNSIQTSMLRQVVDAFVAARLLTTNHLGGITTIEVSHEALIREWARLSTWLREAREDIHLQQTISQDVAQWQQRGKPADRLYHGTQLKEAKAWASRNVPSQHEVAFLQASTRRAGQSLALVLVVALLLLSTTGAASWVLTHQRPDPTRVTTLADDGPGSFRWAVDNAPAMSTITFDPGLHGTIMLKSRDLTIGKPLQIHGPGANVLAISSGASGHIIQVSNHTPVSISGMAFKDSKNLPSTFITNAGTLSLTNCIISGNSTTDFGGGISNFGILSLTNSTVSDNTASGNGGGIYTNTGALSLINSTVMGNMASNHSNTHSQGGGIYSLTTKVTLINSTIEGNSSTDDGGGIFSSGTLSITNSTVSGNTSSGNGGGIASYSYRGLAQAQGMLTLTNSTISGNTASGSTSHGGGIFNFGGQANITFSTIYNNTAVDDGGLSIVNGPQPLSSHVQVRDSIIAGNHAHSSADIAGSLTSGGYNLFQDVSGATFAANTQHSNDVLVGPHGNLGIAAQLAGNLPQTLALLLGSPAIERIPLDACHIDGITTDERGVKRPQGYACDIGAYEYTP
ncbi:MAG: helix-turn-helix domain-containing protein [Chloroflexi bacterium]|nr:helix-turn-helix domain-containing protein [Chloroflexota bacterium]